MNSYSNIEHGFTQDSLKTCREVLFPKNPQFQMDAGPKTLWAAQGRKAIANRAKGRSPMVQHLWLDSRSPGSAELPEGLVTENGMLKNSVQSEQDQTRTWAKLVFCFSFFPKSTLKRGRFKHTWELLKVWLLKAFIIQAVRRGQRSLKGSKQIPHRPPLCLHRRHDQRPNY